MAIKKLLLMALFFSCMVFPCHSNFQEEKISKKTMNDLIESIIKSDPEKFKKDFEFLETLDFPEKNKKEALQELKEIAQAKNVELRIDSCKPQEFYGKGAVCFATGLVFASLGYLYYTGEIDLVAAGVIKLLGASLQNKKEQASIQKTLKDQTLYLLTYIPTGVLDILKEDKQKSYALMSFGLYKSYYGISEMRKGFNFEFDMQERIKNTQKIQKIISDYGISNESDEPGLKF